MDRVKELTAAASSVYGSLAGKEEVVGTEEEQTSLLGRSVTGPFRASATIDAALSRFRDSDDEEDPPPRASGGGGTGAPSPGEAAAGSLLDRARNAASAVSSAGSKAAGAAASATQAAKIATGLEEAPPKSTLEELTSCPAMSYKTRLTGFIICYAIGSLFWLLSTPAIPFILVAPAKFAVPYTLGSLISMASTMFMVGPSRQLKNLCKEDRRATTSIYIGSMFGTLFFAFQNLGILGTLLCLVCIGLQMGSMVWYVASYVPGGQSMVRAFGQKCIACCPSCMSTCLSCLRACCCRSSG